MDVSVNVLDVIDNRGKLKSIDKIIGDADIKHLFLIKKSKNNGDALNILEGKEIFEEQEVEQIKNWTKEEQKAYKDDFYRLDLDKNILFFKKVETEEAVVLLGHTLEPSILNRLLLLELRQKHLLEILQ